MSENKNYFPIVINNLLLRLEDPVGLARPLGRDYSYWQKVVNADAATLNGVLFAAFRSGVGYGYQDPYFRVNYNSFDRDELYRTSYHVPVPGLSVVKQVDNWYKMHPELDKKKPFPRVLDMEIHNNQPASRIASENWQICEMVYARDGMYPILYTRYALANAWLSTWTTDMLNSLYWWLAQYLLRGYLEHPGPPTLPKRVLRKRVIVHQTSDHKLAPSNGEVQSKSVDWDRWELGNEEQMHLFIKEAWGGGVVVPPPLPDDEEVIIERVRVLATPHLNVRAEPSESSQDLGELIRNSVVPVVEVDGVWKRIGQGWIHGDYTEEV